MEVPLVTHRSRPRRCSRRSGLRQLWLGHHSGAVALGCSPAPPLKQRPASRPTDLHQHPLSVSDRSAPVPDENPTGDHRRIFELPDWSYERVLLRFDGVESIYRVWLNGIEVGVGKGSRLVQEFDITDMVRSGRNVIFVRVHQWSSMSLPGGPRSMVAAGHFPRRHRAEPTVRISR